MCKDSGGLTEHGGGAYGRGSEVSHLSTPPTTTTGFINLGEGVLFSVIEFVKFKRGRRTEVIAPARVNWRRTDEDNPGWERRGGAGWLRSLWAPRVARKLRAERRRFAEARRRDAEMRGTG